jgi:hypothetical protein
MRTRDHDTVLEIIDLVLGDLQLRDRMFVARRPDPEHPDLIVIQTGEDGRHALPVPNPRKRRSVEMFIVAAQAHLHEVYGQPVPLCPEHDHALVPRVERGGVEWVCPDGGWSCPLGAYEETTWPPPLDSGCLAQPSRLVSTAAAWQACAASVALSATGAGWHRWGSGRWTRRPSTR